MLNPKISVVMSVFNGMPYLKEAVESILKQTYKDFEFIIVDDGSTDKSWDYLKGLKDPRIKLIKNNKNLGLAKSLNIALKLAKGDYIARMDADDISHQDRFKMQTDFLLKNKTVSLCGCWCRLIDKRGKIAGRIKYPTDPDGIEKKLISFNPIVHPTFMAKRDLYNKLGGYREEYDGAEDYDLLARAIKKGYKIANIPKVLFSLRLTFRRRSMESMKAMDRLDLKIKIELAEFYGLTPRTLFILARKFLLTYLFPVALKTHFARVIKKA